MVKMAQRQFIMKWMWVIAVLSLCLPMSSRAAGTNSSVQFSSSELDTLVSTIALYPDPLLVHVLTASTFGDQIPSANAWAQSHKHLSGEALATEMETANLSYDPSVQALIPFPTVLATMAKYRAWSDQLGDAVSTQKEQVLDAVQRMRQTAYRRGHLQSNEQTRVTAGATIIIEPVRTEYVYVPVYNPRVVYYVDANGYTAVRYGHGVWLNHWYGEWGWGSCWFDWDSHFIYVRDYRWYPHRPIPRHPRHYNPPPRPHRPLPTMDSREAGNMPPRPEPRHPNARVQETPTQYGNPPPPSRNNIIGIQRSSSVEVPLDNRNQGSIGKARAVNSGSIDRDNRRNNSNYGNPSQDNSSRGSSGRGNGGFGKAQRR